MMTALGKSINVNVVGNSNDVTNLIIKQYKASTFTPKPNVFIFTLPRAALESPSFNEFEFCQTIEKGCDGKFATTKYQGGELCIPRPWIFILSNSKIPEVWKKKELLTKDRWREYEVPPLNSRDLQIIEEHQRKIEEGTGKPVAALPMFT